MISSGDFMQARKRELSARFDEAERKGMCLASSQTWGTPEEMRERMRRGTLDLSAWPDSYALVSVDAYRAHLEGMIADHTRKIAAIRLRLIRVTG